MKTQVEFRSSKFPPYEGEEEQINPGLWGKRLAEYLAQKLAEKGIATEELVADDWGWIVPVRNEGFRLGLCCGHQDGDDDEFVCFTEPSTPIVKKLFKKIDATAQLTRLTEALQQILASDPEIRDVVWTESRDGA
jgi:trehalose-6-phosphatase